ncbi:MAG: hypothetical protein L3J82_09360 [Planctomycetes bacterium]|nr:hypothetical protein [Planctomycetota bacterium]
MKWMLGIALMVAVAGCSGEANNAGSSESAPGKPTGTPKVEDKKVHEPVVEVVIYTMSIEDMV